MIDNIRELTIDELDRVSGGYIVKDTDGYHVIDDYNGSELGFFRKDQYDYMMVMIERMWKISDTYITWDQAKEIRVQYWDKYYNG